jgi:catechol 2,3-dioxygenase-like lactoylglutathione lyase family enzyme
MAFEDYELIATAPMMQPERAKAFYRDILGPKLQDENQFALTFRAGRTTLRFQKVSSFTPFPFTLFGWNAPDIEATAGYLKDNSVGLERFPGMHQNELGVWVSPDGSKVGWFKDPDGNLLSLTEFGRAA